MRAASIAPAIVIALATAAAVLAAPAPKVLGAIDFFGYKGLDLTAVRAALPFHEGETIPPSKVTSDGLKKQVNEAFRRVIGHESTDIAFVCCDANGNFTAYIGLPGESYQTLAFNASPTGKVQFPKEAMKLQKDMEDAVSKAVMSGRATEDDSAGYSLTNDPKARKTQLALRDYAVQHEDLVFEILGSSSDAEQRATAVEMLGYARQSDRQVDALIHASLDPGDEVRNNAVRALAVLAGAKPAVSRRIAPGPFVQLLRSGAWTDHNKASLVLMALTETREPQVLAQLRNEALDSLLEMGRWRNFGHAAAALTILGRMAGIEKDELNKLIAAGQAATILAKFTHPPSGRVSACPC